MLKFALLGISLFAFLASGYVFNGGRADRFGKVNAGLLMASAFCFAVAALAAQ